MVIYLKNDGEMVILAIKSRWFQFRISIFGQNEFHSSPPTLKKVSYKTVDKTVMVILPHFLWWNGENPEKMFVIWWFNFVLTHPPQKIHKKTASTVSSAFPQQVECYMVSLLISSALSQQVECYDSRIRDWNLVTLSACQMSASGHSIRLPQFPQHFLSRLNVMTVGFWTVILVLWQSTSSGQARLNSHSFLSISSAGQMLWGGTFVRSPDVPWGSSTPLGCRFWPSDSLLHRDKLG